MSTILDISQVENLRVLNMQPQSKTLGEKAYGQAREKVLAPGEFICDSLVLGVPFWVISLLAFFVSHTACPTQVRNPTYPQGSSPAPHHSGFLIHHFPCTKEGSSTENEKTTSLPSPTTNDHLSPIMQRVFLVEDHAGQEEETGHFHLPESCFQVIFLPQSWS